MRRIRELRSEIRGGLDNYTEIGRIMITREVL
jgi:hypothetical protein